MNQTLTFVAVIFALVAFSTAGGAQTQGAGAPVDPNSAFLTDAYAKLYNARSVAADGRMIQRPVAADGSDLGAMAGSGFADVTSQFFFQPASLLQSNVFWQLFYSHDSDTIGLDNWNGQQCRVLRIANPANSKLLLRIVLDHNGMIGAVEALSGYAQENRNIRVNELSPADFVFHKPAFAYTWSKIDPRATAVLRQAADAYSHVGALTASMVQTTTWPNAEEPYNKPTEVDSHIRIMRPNYWVVETASSTARPTSHENRADDPLNVCDGATEWEYWAPKAKHYDKTSAPEQFPLGQWPLTGGLLDPIFSPNPYDGVGLNADWDGGVESVTFAGTVRWHGDSYREVKWTYAPDERVTNSSRTYFIGADDLIHRIVGRVVHTGGAIEETDTYLTDIDWHPTLAKSDFAFSPPSGATEQPKTFVSFRNAPPVKGALLANGTPAPDFTVQDKDGRAIHLSDYRGKVVVLDCWATWCAPCQAAQPYTNAVGRRFRDKGVVVLGVDVRDSEDAFKAWLPLHTDYDAIIFATDPAHYTITSLYNIADIPAQFVIGRDGRVVWSVNGYDPTIAKQDLLGAAVKKALEE